MRREIDTRGVHDTTANRQPQRHRGPGNKTCISATGMKRQTGGACRYSQRPGNGTDNDCSTLKPCEVEHLLWDDCTAFR